VLTFTDPHSASVQAELLETSLQGFRAAHTCKAMAPGLEVEYRREGASGRARVIWTHILGGRSVSGFLLL
jgi:hypothetical protein